MTSHERFEFHAWARTWIHRLTVDERQGTDRLTIELGHDSDGPIARIDNQREIHITYLLGSR